jgi:Holliday junction DNA helicase RuvA
MIGMLTGLITYKRNSTILLDVRDVGYKILLPELLFHESTLGEKKTYYTYTYVREDALELFGFNEPEDLTLFEKLISVSGIGPRTALNIFSVGSRNDILSAIEKSDTAFFKSVPRLGTKNAQKLIIELRGKLEEDSMSQVGTENTDVVQALEAFGFKQTEILTALKGVEGPPEEKIKIVLKKLGR